MVLRQTPKPAPSPTASTNTPPGLPASGVGLRAELQRLEGLLPRVADVCGVDAALRAHLRQCAEQTAALAARAERLVVERDAQARELLEAARSGQGDGARGQTWVFGRSSP